MAETTLLPDLSASTRSLPPDLDVGKLRELGEAMMFCDQPAKPACRSDTIWQSVARRNFGQEAVAEWLCEDYKHNSMLVKILASEWAQAFVSGQSYIINFTKINEFSQKAFKEDVSALITSINNLKSITVADSTIALAKEVEKLEEEKDVDIQSWANLLGNDIGKGRD